MTKRQSAHAAASVQISSRDRQAILNNVLAALQERFYRPDKLNADWKAAVERHRPLIEVAETADAFERSMSHVLGELHTSHLGFFHRESTTGAQTRHRSSNFSRVN